jgi:methylase of polypeptide subunit release factors
VTRNPSTPTPDRGAATILGERLRSLGYSEPSVIRLLGDDAYTIDRDEAAVEERRLPSTRLGTAVRLFFLQRPATRRDAERALGARALDALERMGLADVTQEVVPRARILPVEDLLVASDDYPGDDERPDFVAAYTPTSQILAALTPRRRVEQALDVGTGSGVQALFAARHTGRVVATDVNPRALAYTELNATLSGLRNVECRPGSLFEPVEDEAFDLVTCNAPYVVSPENRLVYRDAGLPVDEVSKRVIRNAAARLADGGFAALLVSWVAHDADDPDARLLQWLDGIGCDAWVLPVWGADALGHAEIWNEHLADDAERFREIVDTWTAYLARYRVNWVSEGAVVLHRRVGRRHSVRVDEIEEDVEGASEQIGRAFTSRARLAELSGPRALLGERLAVVMPLRLEQTIEPRRGRNAVVEARLSLVDGTESSVDGPQLALELIASLDGSASLGEVVDARAAALRLPGADVARLRNQAVRLSRELLELGALAFAG